MNGYYYLMTSLPPLSFKEGVPLPFTRDSFLEKIDGFVPEGDKKCIEDLLDGKVVKKSGVSAYSSLYADIQEAILYYRKKRLGDSDKIQKPSVDASILEMAEKAVSNENPYDAEMDVLSIYEKALDGLAAFHYADFMALAVYALKLKLLLRKNSFDKEKGESEVKKIFSSYNVLEDLLNG